MIESRQNNTWNEDYGMLFIEKPEDGMENQIQVALPIKKKKEKKRLPGLSIINQKTGIILD